MHNLSRSLAASGLFLKYLKISQMSASIHIMYFYLKKRECAKFAIVCLGKGMNYHSTRQSQQTIMISRRSVRSLFQAGKRLYVSCINITVSYQKSSQMIRPGDIIFSSSFFLFKSHVFHAESK